MAPTPATGRRLPPRELEVLAAMAEGRSNAAIGQQLFLSESAVGKHIASIFGKLGLAPSEDDHRRVLAVLAYLSGWGHPGASRRTGPPDNSDFSPQTTATQLPPWANHHPNRRDQSRNGDQIPERISLRTGRARRYLACPLRRKMTPP